MQRDNSIGTQSPPQSDYQQLSTRLLSSYIIHHTSYIIHQQHNSTHNTTTPTSPIPDQHNTRPNFEFGRSTTLDTMKEPPHKHQPYITQTNYVRCSSVRQSFCLEPRDQTKQTFCDLHRHHIQIFQRQNHHLRKFHFADVICIQKNSKTNGPK